MARHLEIVLTTLGLIIIVSLMIWVSPDSRGKWQAIAVVSTVIASFHGVLMWIARVRRNRARVRTIRQVGRMLSDRINNDLTIVAQSLDANDERRHGKAVEAIGRISEQVNSLSEDSLDAWKDRYPNL